MQHAPFSSALVRAGDPDSWITPEIQMLREVTHRLDVLAWQKTEDATKKPPRNYPVRLPLTVEEVRAAKDAAPLEPAPIPVEDMRDWLGWNDPAFTKEAS